MVTTSESEESMTGQCPYCSQEIEGNRYKTIIRFAQKRKYGILKVCYGCIAELKSHHELSTDWNDRLGSDYNFVADQTSQYKF